MFAIPGGAFATQLFWEPNLKANNEYLTLNDSFGLSQIQRQKSNVKTRIKMKVLEVQVAIFLKTLLHFLSQSSQITLLFYLRNFLIKLYLYVLLFSPEKKNLIYGLIFYYLCSNSGGRAEYNISGTVLLFNLFYKDKIKYKTECFLPFHY